MMGGLGYKVLIVDDHQHNLNTLRTLIQKHLDETVLEAASGREAIDLTLFHGRGGTASRGGSKTHVAVLGAPPGTVNGRLRVTEQGEIINAKYGLRGIAVRTLEQAAGSVALAIVFTAVMRTNSASSLSSAERSFRASSGLSLKTLAWESPSL